MVTTYYINHVTVALIYTLNAFNDFITKIPPTFPINRGILYCFKHPKPELKSSSVLFFQKFLNFYDNALLLFEVRRKVLKRNAQFITVCHCILRDRRQYTSSTREREELF